MLVAGVNIFVSLSCRRCLTQEDQGRHYFKTLNSLLSKNLEPCFDLSSNDLAWCCDSFFFPFFQVKGMDLAHLTREAAIQGTEVALGMPFILGPVNVFLPMSYV